MTNSEPEDGTTRDDLVQRIALMEAMIAEGRRSTTRCGWIFVLWGVVDLAGIGWQLMQPHSYWVWPVTLSSGFVLMFLLRALQKPGAACLRNMQCRSVEAVWIMMGVATTLYVAAAIVRHFTWQISYIAAILMLVGMAHATSAMILRWRVQGAVAGLWWVGGIAMYFIPKGKDYAMYIFSVEMLLGMVVFGLYAMMLERRDRDGRASANA
jgi:hypothetical protein